MKTTSINLMVAAAPVLAATEALRQMSGLPWVFAVMLAVAIVSVAFAATLVVGSAVSSVTSHRAPLSVSKRGARATA